MVLILNIVKTFNFLVASTWYPTHSVEIEKFCYLPLRFLREINFPKSKKTLDIEDLVLSILPNGDHLKSDYQKKS